MNKYQEALYKVAKICCPTISYKDENNENEIGVLMSEEIKLLQELVDKATPKKVTHEASKRTSCTCPNCLNVVDLFEIINHTKVRVRYGYCKICGQALDWSEDDD